MITRFARPHIEELPRDDWPAGLLEKLPEGMNLPHSLEIRVAGMPTVLQIVTNHDTGSTVRRWELTAAVRVAASPTAHIFKSSTRFVDGDTEDEVTNDFMQTVLMYTIRCVEEIAEGDEP